MRMMVNRITNPSVNSAMQPTAGAALVQRQKEWDYSQSVHVESLLRKTKKWPLKEWFLFIKIVAYLCFLKGKKKSWRKNLKRLIITDFYFGSVASMIDFSTVTQTKQWEQVAQRGCRIFILGDTQNLTGHGSEKPTVADPALSMDWTRCLPEAPPNSSILWLLETETGYNTLMSCVPLTDISHGILQSEIPTWTPTKRWC